MTHDEIEKLQGVELAAACCREAGWGDEVVGNFVKARESPDSMYWWFEPHADANDARQLVATLSGKSLYEFDLILWKEMMDEPHEHARCFLAPLETICKCFLKARAKAGGE